MYKRSLVPTLVAVLALCGAYAANASAHEFVASKVGAFAGKELSSQRFSTGAGAYECSKETISGTTTALRSSTLKVSVQYKGCSYFGSSLEVSPARYELNANGTVKLLEQMTMIGSYGLFEFFFPAQGPLSTVTYADKALEGSRNGIELTSAIAKIESGGEGVFGYEMEKGGSLTGKSLLEMSGGSIEWV
jgi:hypothetical protein